MVCISIKTVPDCLRYQFTKEFNLKLSDKCCYKLKKEIAHKYEEESNKTITITGMRAEEGGMRGQNGCTIFDGGKLKKLHPLMVVDEQFEEDFIKHNNIKLCELYYPPYNFKRTGCKGCPFALDLQQQLDLMQMYLPNEYKQCNIIWKSVYDEYRRIGYRLDKKTEYEQVSIFDL